MQVIRLLLTRWMMFHDESILFYWYDNAVCYVLDQQYKLNIKVLASWNNSIQTDTCCVCCSNEKHYPDVKSNSLFPLLLLQGTYLGKKYIQKSGLTPAEIHLTYITLKVSMLIITELRGVRIYANWQSTNSLPT